MLGQMSAPGSVLLKVLIKRINLGLWKGKYLSLHASSNYKPWLVNKRSEIWRYFNKFTENEARRLLGCKKKNICNANTCRVPRKFTGNGRHEKAVHQNKLTIYLFTVHLRGRDSKEESASGPASERARKQERAIPFAGSLNFPAVATADI